MYQSDYSQRVYFTNLFVVYFAGRLRTYQIPQFGSKQNIVEAQEQLSFLPSLTNRTKISFSVQTMSTKSTFFYTQIFIRYNLRSIFFHHCIFIASFRFFDGLVLTLFCERETIVVRIQVLYDFPFPGSLTREKHN